MSDFPTFSFPPLTGFLQAKLPPSASAMKLERPKNNEPNTPVCVLLTACYVLKFSFIFLGCLLRYNLFKKLGFMDLAVFPPLNIIGPQAGFNDTDDFTSCLGIRNC